MKSLLSKSKRGWGIWDALDKCWIGTDAGPNVYRDRDVALAAACVVAECIDAAFGRIGVRKYDGTGTKKKDNVMHRHGMTPALALRRIEAGTVLTRVRADGSTL